jgi:hypothetical protein
MYTVYILIVYVLRACFECFLILQTYPKSVTFRLSVINKWLCVTFHIFHCTRMKNVFSLLRGC